MTMNGVSTYPKILAQIPLDVALRDGLCFASFMPGNNQLLLDRLKAQAHGKGELQMYVYGENACGKSHLGHATCHQAGLLGYAGACIDADLLLQAGVEALEGLESLALLCIDNIHRLTGDRVWEEGLYNLINATRSSGTRLLLTSRYSPHTLTCVLPDLHSRILWGPVFQIQELNDADKRRLLIERAHRRGFELADDACDYLLRHSKRDLPSLIQLLDYLDQASLAAQRRLTIPFIRQLLPLHTQLTQD